MTLTNNFVLNLTPNALPWHLKNYLESNNLNGCSLTDFLINPQLTESDKWYLIKRTITDEQLDKFEAIYPPHCKTICRMCTLSSGFFPSVDYNEENKQKFLLLLSILNGE